MNRPFVFINVAMTADGKIDTFARKGAAISSQPNILKPLNRLGKSSLLTQTLADRNVLALHQIGVGFRIPTLAQMASTNEIPARGFSGFCLSAFAAP